MRHIFQALHNHNIEYQKNKGDIVMTRFCIQTDGETSSNQYTPNHFVMGYNNSIDGNNDSNNNKNNENNINDNDNNN